MANSKKSKKNQKKSKNKRNMVIAFSLALFLSLLILGSALFFIFIAPDMIVKASQKKMLSLKKFHYRGNLEVKGTLEGVPADFVFNLEGDLDESSNNNPKHSLKITSESNLSSFNMNSDIDFKIISDKFYIKMNKLPDILAIYGDFSNVLGKWSVGQLKKNKSSDKELEDILNEGSFFNNIKTLKAEKINNTKTYHYKVNINNEALKKMSQEKWLGEILSETEKNNLEKLAESISKYPVEIWLGKEDYYIYRLKGRLPFNSENSNADLNFDFTLSGFNESFKINSPETAEPAENLIMPFWENFKKLQVTQI